MEMLALLCVLSNAVTACASLLPLSDIVDDGRHRLSDAQSDGIYDSVLRKAHFEGVLPADSPTLTIIAGQPGSGKSTAMRQLIEASAAPHFTVIEKDRLRTFHPGNEALLREVKYFSSAYMHHDTKRWFDRLLADAISGRFNIVLHQCGIVPDGNILWLRLVRERGYRIILRILAVPFFSSELGIVERYETARKYHGFGRLTPQEKHQKHYDALTELLRNVELYQLADSISVGNFAGDTVYDSSAKGNTVTATQAFVRERTRGLTPDESKEQCARLQSVIAMMVENGSAADDPSRYAAMLSALQTQCTEPIGSMLVSPFGALL